MRTALLTALLLTAPLALAEDVPEGAEPSGEEVAGEEQVDANGLPLVDMDKKIDACSKTALMQPCEVEGLIGLCQLEPCEAGWKDGARACKQCVPYAKKPEEEAPEEPEPMLDADEEKSKAGGKKRRRKKKRDCGCTSTGGAGGLALLVPALPLVLRRRR